MNKQDTVKILAMIKVSYPKFFISEDKAEAKLQLDTWQDLFSSESFKLVEQAVKALICTLKFPPTIADVKEKVALLTQTRSCTEMEAWGKVLNAIKNSSYKAQEMFDGLPGTCKRIIGSPNQLREWAAMDTEIVNSVIQSNFMRSYKSMVSQEKEYSMLPESAKELKKILSETANKILME